MKSQTNRGFVLVTSLIFLIVLSVLGVMAMRGSLFEERMSSSDRDRTLAREYAELALRDAERDIMGIRFDGALCAVAGGCGTLRPAGTRPPNAIEQRNFWNASAATNYDAVFDDGGRTLTVPFQGVYTPESSTACGMPIWSGANWQDGANPARSCAGTIGAAVPTIAYGTFTNAPFPGEPGTTLPRYLIEVFSSPQLTGRPDNKVFFRITAVGFGRTVGPNGQRTSVTLQSVFSPS
jgi:Tfp pilus assembly protein PilX